MLLIYLPVVSSRSEYIFELIFKNELGLDYRVTTELQIFEAHQQEKINYSPSRINDEFFIEASPLLFEDFIKRTQVIVEGKISNQSFIP